MTKQEIELTRNHHLSEAEEMIISAENAHSELTMIKDYMGSIAHSLLVLASTCVEDGNDHAL